MKLDFISTFISNKSFLFFFTCQIFILLFSFYLYKKGKFYTAIFLILSINFSLIVYLIYDFYIGYNYFLDIYGLTGYVPVPVLLKGMEQTEVFFIVEAVLNILSLLIVYIMIRFKIR